MFTKNTIFGKKDSRKYALALLAIAQYGSALDEMFWTPIRDLQVFGKHAFSSGFGPGHSILNIASTATGIVASLPFIFKVFNENETNTLHALLQNCEREFGIKCFDSEQPLTIKKEFKEEIEESLKKHLHKEGIYDIDPIIVEKTKRNKFPPFRKKAYWDIEYRFNKHLEDLLSPEFSNLTFPNLCQKIFKIDETVLTDYLSKILSIPFGERLSLPILLKKLFHTLKHDKEKRKDLESELKQVGMNVEMMAAFNRICSLFYDKDESKYDPTMTIEKSRQKFSEEFNQISFGKVATGACAFFNDSSFHFWLGFAVFDFFKNQPDTREWNLKEQLIAIGVGLAGGLAKAALSIVDFIKNRLPSSTKKNDIKGKTTTIIEQPQALADNSLKHRQLEYLFIQQQAKSIKRKPRAKYKDYHSDIKEILDLTSAKEVELFFPMTAKKSDDSVKAHIETIKSYIDSTFDKGSAGAAEVAGKAVAGSFLQWYASAAIFAGLMWAGAKSTALKVGAILNDGITGPVIALGSFVLGMIGGGTYYHFKGRKEIQSKKEEIKAKYEANKDKLIQLEKLVEQNMRLEQIAVKSNIPLPHMLKPHDDRGHRRLVTHNTSPNFTRFKKAVNRFCVAVGKFGSGLLLYRSLPMIALPLLPHIPFLAHVAFFATVGTAVSAVAWPVALVAMGVGAAWAGIYTYRYIKERKFEASERFLNDVDNRLRLAKKNQKSLLHLLDYEKAIENNPCSTTEKNISKITAVAPEPVLENAIIIDKNRSRSQKKEEEMPLIESPPVQRAPTYATLFRDAGKSNETGLSPQNSII